MRDRRRNYDKSCAGLPSRDPLCCPYRFVGAPRQSSGGDRPRLCSVVRSTGFRRESCKSARPAYVGLNTMSSDSVPTTLKFGPFELSTRERFLRRDGVVLPLGSRALDILIYLAERPGEVIGKKQLIDQVWSDVNVEEGSLRVHVAAIRKALADGQFGNRYVANVQGRGYSFVGQVTRLEDGAIDSRDRGQNEVRLPTQLLRTIGRESVLDDVKDRIRNDRFVTLLGPGGIGKTTVAVAAGHAMAEEFNGGVHFVDLGSLTDPHHVPAAVGTSLGLALNAKDAIAELLDVVRSKKLLIILDSCEHLIDTVASLAERLFQEATQVHVLATSRELLRVEGEYCYRILPLDFPPGSLQTTNALLRYPAIQLFVERVAAKGGNFVLTDAEAPYVAEMCRKLDGVPLAIELAAGRVAALGIKNTVTSLVSRLELLKLGRRTSVPRHRTLRATLDWSYDLLSDIERIVVRRIAPFVGHFTLEGAHYVAGELGSSDGGIFDAIAGLVEKSLLTTRIDETQVLYRLLDTTRAYALEKLELHTEKDTVLLRHAQYVTEHLESRREVLATQARAERVAFYSSQLGNVRAALEWSFGPHGDDEIAIRLAAACTQLFLELSLMIDCQVWAERAIARLGDQHRNTSREMEIYAALPLALMHTEGSNQRVHEGFYRALDVAVKQQDPAYELRFLSGLFLYARWTTDINGALDIATRSKKVASQTQDPDDMALAESMLGAVNHLAGNHPAAQTHFEAGLRYSASGLRFRAGQYLFHHTSLLLVGMARSLLYRGLFDQARAYAKVALEEGEKSGHPATLCRTLCLILPVYLTLADYQLAEQYITQLTDLSASSSLKPYRAVAAGLRGQWLLLQNDLSGGILLLKRALQELQDQRHEMLNTDFVCDLSAGLVATGKHEEALTLIVNALEVQQRGGKNLYVPALLRMKGLTLVSRSTEDYAEAESSLLSSIDWARRQSASLYELKSASDLAELLLLQARVPEAHRHISTALNGTPEEMRSPVHERARQILARLQSGAKAADWP
jgi:predicted ATPase/DNA-binding winged helix-turn-helix (wHTH) protein/tetratricopeptide (TPR) repeat protein